MENVTTQVKISRTKIVAKLILHSFIVGAATVLVGGFPGMSFAQESSSGALLGFVWILVVLIVSIVFTSKSKTLGFEEVSKQGGLPYIILLTLFSLVSAGLAIALIVALKIGSGIGSAL